MTTAQTLLPWLKTDLGITSNVYDTRLTAYIENAQSAITREGIILTDSVEDNQLVIMYAAWTWNKRTTGEGMPRMLRYALNNRLFSGKARET